MIRAAFAVLAATALLGADEDPQVVFRSDVSLVRVDAQVLDRSNRAIAGLSAEDFVLRDGGREQPIRNFVNEDMPVDLVFLIDVSGSMRPHVERLAEASQRALDVLGRDDRVAIMVFDRATRVRSGFVPPPQVKREMELLLDHEGFNGGTDITRALLDAANYVSRNARREARRAIVILTDDRTEFERNDSRVGRALVAADAVLMALLAPDAMGGGGAYPYPRGGGGGGGGGWPTAGPFPGGGGPLGGPLGGIILGRGGRGPGGRYPGGGRGGSNTRSAGTAEIARQSGGDSMPVHDASALETTLSRIRQRYALYFLVPGTAKPGEERQIEVTLSTAARRRYPDAEVRYRREYLAPSSAGTSTPAAEPVVISSTAETNAEPVAGSDPPKQRRRPAADGSGGPRGPNLEVGAPASEPGTPAVEPAAPSAPAPSTGGGWRRVKPGEKP